MWYLTLIPIKAYSIYEQIDKQTKFSMFISVMDGTKIKLHLSF